MIKTILGIAAVIGLIMLIKRARKKGENVYNDKTIKNYKRWHR